MNREVERVKKIPAFSINILDLEILIDRILDLFKEKDKLYYSIYISLRNEKLEFNSINELKNYEGLNGKITDFRIWLNQGRKRISIRVPSFYSQAEVITTSSSEAWCAGANETIYSFLQNKKVWYHWIASVPLGILIFIILNIPFLIRLFIPEANSISKVSLIGWISTIITLLFLYFFRKKLFPVAILRITEEESFIRKHSAEIGLIIAIISMLLSIIGWFVIK